MAVILVVCVGLRIFCTTIHTSGDQHALKGYRLLAKEQYAEGARHLEIALEKGLSKEKPEVVYSCLGNAYNQMEEFEKAIRMHKKATEANPDFYEAWVNLGIVYRLTGDFAEAERCYAKAYRLEPDYAELHSSLGVLYTCQGKHRKAVQHLERAVHLDRQLASAWSNLAIAYASINEFGKAQAALKRAVALGYKNGPIIQERIDGLKATAQGH